VATGRGVAGTCGVFCPAGELPGGFGVGLTAGWFAGNPGWPGVAAGLGAFGFSGVPFGTLGDPAGTFPLGDCFGSAGPGVVGFSPARVGEPPGVTEGCTVGEAPGVPAGFAPSKFAGTDLFPAAVALGEAPGALGDPPRTLRLGDCFSSGEPGVVGFPPGPVGEPPGVPEGFSPSRFGGMDFFPAAAAFGEAPGITFAFGEPAAGFNKLGGDFCPVIAGGEPLAPGVPVAPGDPVTCALLRTCEFTKGVGFGRSLGGGFCSAMVFLSFSAS
jgi:hypothetical protein